MSEKFEKFRKIDDLLSDIGQLDKFDNKVLTKIGDLCNEIDSGLETRKTEVVEWSDERKRKEAMDSKDPFVLNLLSMDESFNIRALSACNSNTTEASLLRLAENGNDYIKMLIANNPNCPPYILDRISEMSIEKEVLSAVAGNANTSTVTRHKIVNRM